MAAFFIGLWWVPGYRIYKVNPRRTQRPANCSRLGPFIDSYKGNFFNNPVALLIVFIR